MKIGSLVEGGRGAHWISLEGVEGVGKTTVAEQLKRDVGTVVIVPEFSPTPLGTWLRRALEQDPHYVSSSIVSQSLLFFADLAQQTHAVMFDDWAKARIVVQDRGHLSRRVYQYVVLESLLGEPDARRVVDAVCEVIPRPSTSVLLTAKPETIFARLRRRGYDLTPDRIRFIARALDVFEESFHKYEYEGGIVMQTPEMSVREVANSVRAVHCS